MQNTQTIAVNPAFSIPAAAESYILELKISNASPRTIEWYEMLFNLFASWCRGQKINSINEVSAEQMRRYFLYLEKDKWNPRTQAHGISQRSRASHFKGLKTWFNYLVREDWIKVSPLANVKPVKMPKDQVLPLEEDEIKAILSKSVITQKSFLSKRNYTIVWLLLDTGLRRSELLDLEIRDINIDARTLHIRNGKGGKQRTVPFGLATRKVLVKYLDRVKRMERLTDKIFITGEGLPLQERALNRILERIGMKAKITRMILSPHKLRHTFAVEYLCNGGDVFSLKDILGHESIQMTMKYVHFSDSRLKKQSQQFSPGDAITRRQN